MVGVPPLSSFRIVWFCLIFGELKRAKKRKIRVSTVQSYTGSAKSETQS